MTTSLDRRTALAGLAAALLPLGRAAAQIAAEEGVVLAAGPVAGAPITGCWGFGDALGGPVIRIRHGDELRATLRNGTTQPLSLHWHGVRGPAASDGVGGVSQPPVPPGGSAPIRFTPPDAGTFLIRPLVVGGSGEPAGRGLSGMLVVEEREPPAFDAEYALLVRDWLVDPAGVLAPFGRTEEAALAGRLGNRMTVGEREAPWKLTLPAGSRVRLRVANGCNARIMRIRFEGMKAFVGAVDGQPTDTFEPLRASLPFGPGSRYDVFFDVPREPGRTAAVVAQLGPGIPLVEITAAETGAVGAKPDIVALRPNRLLPPEIFLQNALRRDLVVTGGAMRGESGEVRYSGPPAEIWKINGTAGRVGAPPLFSVRRGQPVVLAIRNETGFVQPIHVHGHVFRLLHPLDDGWEPYWLDTMQVPEGKTVRIALLAGEPGRWLVSSPVLERFDTGLWTSFEVT